MNTHPLGWLQTEDDEWLLGHMLEDCEALDKWIENGGNGLDGLASAE